MASLTVQYSTKKMVSILDGYNYAEGVSEGFIGVKIYNIDGVYCWNGDINAPITLDAAISDKLWIIKPIKVEFEKAYAAFLTGKQVRLKDYVFDIGESKMLQAISENFKEIEWEILD